jgi:Ca-activated chloride channel family protein
MSGELDHIRAAFREESPILPSPAARAAAIARATAAFAQDSEARRQGMRPGTRLMDRLKGFIRRSHTMPSIRLTHSLLAGSSLAVLGLVVLNVANSPQSGIGMKGADDATTLLSGELAKEEIAEPAPAAGRTSQFRRDAEKKSKDAVVASRQRPAAPAAKVDALSVAPAPSTAAEGRMAVIGSPAGEADAIMPGYHDQGRDRFADFKANPVKVAAEEPVSTFSIDVDTASYSFVRAALNQNVLPRKDAVRVEEMINYFPYDYAGPENRNTPFKASVTLMPSPWNPDTRLMHVGIKGFALNGQEKPRSNLVFLIDTSGSMDEPNKLPLLRNSLKMLTESLAPEDTVSIVVYAGSAGTVLEPTKARDKAKIIAALDNLSAGGSTAGAEGIRRAYQLAEQSFERAGINRVILATDGDFNVGITDPEELKNFVERKRETGVYLSVLGFGRGNYNDELMQALAQNGNGNAAYIDTLSEARKVLVDEASATLFPIAKDVKIQVEFNPQMVSEYRLIGYETRMLNREDFNNDKVDAGEIGAGHTVTAIYEITPKDSKAALVDPLRYQQRAETGQGGEYAFLKIRYKLPGEDQSKLISTPVTDADAKPSPEATFAAAVAAFGQILRGGQYTKAFSYDDVITLAQSAKGADPFGYRAEFINLVRMAKTAQALEPLNP